jgi:hypothetical protein
MKRVFMGYDAWLNTTRPATSVCFTRPWTCQPSKGVLRLRDRKRVASMVQDSLRECDLAVLLS